MTAQRKRAKICCRLFDLWVDEFTWSRSSLEVFFTAGKFGEENIFEAFIPDKKSNFINPWGAELSLAASGAEFSNLAITSPQSQLGTFNVDTESVIATRMTVRQPSEVVVIPLSDERLHQNRDALGVTSINNSGTSFSKSLISMTPFWPSLTCPQWNPSGLRWTETTSHQATSFHFHALSPPRGSVLVHAPPCLKGS